MTWAKYLRFAFLFSLAIIIVIIVITSTTIQFKSKSKNNTTLNEDSSIIKIVSDSYKPNKETNKELNNKTELNSESIDNKVKYIIQTDYKPQPRLNTSEQALTNNLINATSLENLLPEESTTINVQTNIIKQIAALKDLRTASLEKIPTGIDQQKESSLKYSKILNQIGTRSLVYKKTIIAKSGDNLSLILNDIGVESQDEFRIVSAIQKQIGKFNIYLDQKISLYYRQASKTELVKMNFIHDDNYFIEVLPKKESFIAIKKKIPFEKKVIRFVSLVENSLFDDAVNHGVNKGIMFRLIKLLAHSVDFQRDIKKDTRIELVYDEYHNEEFDLKKSGTLLFAYLRLDKKRIMLYNYKIDKNNLGYFDENGNNIKKTLLRTPIDGARLSSKYGMRKHPILGYSKMHKGVDFAAPVGTPIYSAGDGVIDYVGTRGGYGKYVRIRHNKTYSTAYAHLNGYKRGLKKGKKVRQGDVIAYLGNTGRSTGPHLHYEVIKNGKQVNPSLIQTFSTSKLSGKKKKKFIELKRKLDYLRYNTNILPGILYPYKLVKKDI